MNKYSALLQFFIDLLEDKKEGIFVLLEDESKQRTPSVANFMNRTVTACSKKPAFGITLGTRNDSFIIRHFAENVTYSSVKLTFSIKYIKKFEINKLKMH